MIYKNIDKRLILFLVIGVANLHALIQPQTTFFSNYGYLKSSTLSLLRSEESSVTVLQASVINDLEKQKQKKTEDTLRFSGELTFTSDSLPNAKSQDLIRFLTGDDCRRLLLGSGGTRFVEALPKSSKLQHMWTTTAQKSSGLVVENDNLHEQKEVEYYITDTIVKFPGLTLTNTVVNGFTVIDNKEGSSPKCVSMLIGESRKVSGQKGLVWIFNKLTGDDGAKKRGEEYSKPQAGVVTHSSVVETKDGTPTFQVNVKFQVLINCPKAFIRFLPVSKTRMESQGSSAIERAMSKDFEKAVKGVRAGFMKWYSSFGI